MSIPHPVPASLQADYEAIEAAVMETEKGRWFLAEYAKRHRAADTDAVLTAISGLERLMRRERRPDIDRIRLDIGEMKEAIERTKLEIAQIKTDHTASSRFDKASNELDAIVSQTEQATSEILGAAEKIQEHVWTMREAGVDEALCEEVEALTTTIYMACSFQDLTGQRTQKVVHVLRYLETRIDAMIGIWGMDEANGSASAPTPHMEITEAVDRTDASTSDGGEAGPSLGSNPLDTRPDAHLLNGPAMEGEGIDQGQIDDLLFDSIDLSDADIDAVDAEIEALEALAADEDGDGDGIEAPALEDAESVAAPDEADALLPIGLDDLQDDPFDGFEPEAAAVEEPDDEAMAQAARAMEDAIDTLQKVTETIRGETREEDADDPLTRLTRAERQALFS